MLVEHKRDEGVGCEALASEGFSRAVFEDSSKSDDMPIIVKKDIPSIDVILLTHELKKLRGLERIPVNMYIEIVNPLYIQSIPSGLPFGLSWHVRAMGTRVYERKELISNFVGDIGNIHDQSLLLHADLGKATIFSIDSDYATDYIINDAEIIPVNYSTNSIFEYMYEAVDNTSSYSNEVTYQYQTDIVYPSFTEYSIRYKSLEISGDEENTNVNIDIYEDSTFKVIYTIDNSAYFTNLVNNSLEIPNVESAYNLSAFITISKNIADNKVSDDVNDTLRSIHNSANYILSDVSNEEFAFDKKLRFEHEILSHETELVKYESAVILNSLPSTSNYVNSTYETKELHLDLSRTQHEGVSSTILNTKELAQIINTRIIANTNTNPVIGVVELEPEGLKLADDYESVIIVMKDLTKEEVTLKINEINHTIYTPDYMPYSQAGITDLPDINLEGVLSVNISSENLELNIEEFASDDDYYTCESHEYYGILKIEEGYYKLASINVDESLEGKTLLDAAYQALLNAGFDVELDTQTFFDAEIGEEVTGRYILLRKDGKEYKVLESELNDEELRQYGIEIKLNGRRPEYKREKENPLETTMVEYGDVIEVDVVVQGVYNDSNANTDCGTVRVAYQAEIDEFSNLQDVVDSYDSEEARISANEFFGDDNFELNAYIQRKGQNFAVRYEGDFSEMRLQEGDVVTLQYDSTNN